MSVTRTIAGTNYLFVSNICDLLSRFLPRSGQFLRSAAGFRLGALVSGAETVLCSVLSYCHLCVATWPSCSLFIVVLSCCSVVSCCHRLTMCGALNIRECTTDSPIYVKGMNSKSRRQRHLWRYYFAVLGRWKQDNLLAQDYPPEARRTEGLILALSLRWRVIVMLYGAGSRVLPSLHAMPALLKPLIYEMSRGVYHLLASVRS